MPARLNLPESAPCLGGCGVIIPIDTHGRRQKFVKNGGLYCKDCVRKMNSERMKSRNPMSNPEYLEKMRSSLKGMGHHPKTLGGNGRGYTRGQRMLLEKLGRGWWPELVVPTRKLKDMLDCPTSYKIDIANVYYGIAIEIDGGSHFGEQARREDERKDSFLKSKGWTVLRFRNKEVIDNLDAVLAVITSTILKCKETIITLPTEY